MIRKMKPNSAKKVTVTAPLAARNRRSRNRLEVEHRVGEVRRSTDTNVSRSAALSAKPPIVYADAQPARAPR